MPEVNTQRVKEPLSTRTLQMLSNCEMRVHTSTVSHTHHRLIPTYTLLYTLTFSHFLMHTDHLHSHTYTHTHTRTHTHCHPLSCTLTGTHTHIPTYTHPLTLTHTPMFTHAHLHFTHPLTHACTCPHSHIHTLTLLIHIHTLTHAHSHPPTLTHTLLEVLRADRGLRSNCLC